MPRVPPFDRPATYEDLVAVPEPLVAEIVDGELHASPRPAPLHAVAGSSLSVLVAPYQHGRGGPGGWWVLYEPELHLAEDVLVPDWAGWRRRRMPTPPTDTAWFALAPDWVCEILSPSTASLDRGRKLRAYARHEIPHAWLVDPLARTLEVLRLEDGRWSVVAVHAGSQLVRAEPFPEIELELQALWIDPPARSGAR